LWCTRTGPKRARRSLCRLVSSRVPWPGAGGGNDRRIRELAESAGTLTAEQIEQLRALLPPADESAS